MHPWNWQWQLLLVPLVVHHPQGAIKCDPLETYLCPDVSLFSNKWKVFQVAQWSKTDTGVILGSVSSKLILYLLRFETQSYSDPREPTKQAVIGVIFLCSVELHYQKNKAKCDILYSLKPIVQTKCKNDVSLFMHKHILYYGLFSLPCYPIQPIILFLSLLLTLILLTFQTLA